MALLVIAVLATGIVFAVIRQPGGPGRAQPSPTVPTMPTEPTPTEPTPTEEPTPTKEPTPTEEPTVEPTEEPGPPDDGVVGGVPPGGVPLAETGGPVLPWLAGGSLLIGLAAALWRYSRAR
ncbi:MAG TPA: hypothetical protein VHL78_11915 [Actinomycetota bacterium]|nr:hypothetical protein [Actinomycetota bacterium]